MWAWAVCSLESTSVKVWHKYTSIDNAWASLWVFSCQFILVSYESSTDCMSHCAEHACDPRLTPFMSPLSPMNLTERDRHCVCVCCPTLITALPQQHDMYRILTPKIRTKWCWVISVSHLQPPTNAHGWARAHSPTVPLIEKLHSPKKQMQMWQKSFTVKMRVILY